MKYLVFAFAMIFSSLVEAKTISGTAEIVDGDTIKINGTLIELIDIDAPELKQKCRITENGQVFGSKVIDTYMGGEEAKLKLKEVVGKSPLSCELNEGNYGFCYTSAKIDIGLELLNQGYAFPLPPFQKSSYKKDYYKSKKNKKGIWRGFCQSPKSFRKFNKN